MKLTNSMKVAGELAIRQMSDKAQQGYGDTDPLDVYEYESLFGTRYAVRNCDNVTTWGLTFDDLQAYLESWVFDDEEEDED